MSEPEYSYKETYREHIIQQQRGAAIYRVEIRHHKTGLQSTTRGSYSSVKAAIDAEMRSRRE